MSAVEEMQLFSDKEKLTPLSRIDLGRIPLGKKTEFVAYLSNNSKQWPIQNIKINTSDPEVRISHPELLMPGEAAPVKIEFSPSITRRKPLDISHLFTGELWIG